MSEVYLWCSINSPDLDLRQFFADMSDQELSHARKLDEISNSSDADKVEMNIDISAIQKEERLLDETIAFVKKNPALDDLFMRIAVMESQELNLIFESICQPKIIGEKLSATSEVNTKIHINMLKKAIEKLPLREETQRAINDIQVKDKDYYKLFTS
jgi:rubrerythrin